MRVGIADHFGWAVAVTATADGHVVDRRRLELVEPGVTPAPIHYDSSRLDLAATEELLAAVQASVRRAAGQALDELAAALPADVESIAMRTWPAAFPTDVATLRRAPYESRADAIMYRRILAELADERGWRVRRYDARRVLAEATELLGDRAGAVLDGPRARLGAPWTRDHRTALAATLAAG